MDETELLRLIRPIWVNRTTLSLAKGTGVREDLRAQLERFFDLMEQVISTGDPAWLDPLLSLWSTSLTQTDLESGQSSLTQFIREIMLQTNQVCRETLESEKALDLMYAVIPCFAHAFEKSAYYEMQVRVAYISNQLQQAQQNLERLDRSKSDFIAVAAHELKTPLTLIEGYTAMLRDARDPKTASASELRTVERDQQRHAPPEEHHRRYDRCIADRQQPDAAKFSTGVDQPPAQRAEDRDGHHHQRALPDL